MGRWQNTRIALAESALAHEQKRSRAIPHPDVVEAHQSASYIGIDGPIEYDAQTGILKLNSGTDRLTGTPGEVFTDSKFYCPGVNTEADRLNIAFEIGFLIGRKQLAEGDSD